MSSVFLSAGQIYVENHYFWSFSEIFTELEMKSKLVHAKLCKSVWRVILNELIFTKKNKSKFFRLSDFTVAGDDVSPIKHVRLIAENTIENLEKIVNYVGWFFWNFSKYKVIFDFFSFFSYSPKVQTKNVSITVARYLKDEVFQLAPSIRIIVNVDLTTDEIELLSSILEDAINQI